MSRLAARQEAPPMPKGTLFVVTRRATVYVRPKKDPEILCKLKKKTSVISLGEFAPFKGKVMVKVLTPAGPGWVRVRDVAPAEGVSPASEG